MEEDLYDEFGNYIGPDINSDQEEDANPSQASDAPSPEPEAKSDTSMRIEDEADYYQHAAN
jgi:U5 small nuclear ribonucleoprotein component